MINRQWRLYASLTKPLPSERFEAKYQHLKKVLQEILQDHPSYGYRRIIPELKEAYGITINHKPLKILLNLWGLSLKRKITNPEKSGILKILEYLGVKANLIKSLGVIQPFSLIYTNMTEINYAHGKLYLIVYLDHVTKQILGSALSQHPDTKLALQAFKQASLVIKYKLKQLRLTPEEIVIHQDRGAIYTSYAYVGAILQEDFTQLVQEQILYYNQKRRHSSLQNLSPINFTNLLTARVPEFSPWKSQLLSMGWVSCH